MSRWQITKPPPASATPRVACRRRGYVRRCNCGKPAVAKAIVQVGLDGCYTVSLYLCPACLAIEQASDTIPPPLSIIPL